MNYGEVKVFGKKRARRLAKAVAKRATTGAGLHVRPYTGAVQGLEPWRDVNVLLRGAPRPMILDVGANRGQSATHFAGLWPNAEIHCFEPSPSTFAILQRNVSSLPCVVHPVNAGVAAEHTHRLLLENSQSDMSSFLAATDQAWGEQTAETSVEMVTLDDYCADAGIERVDLLKSDTQGYDLEVLHGAERLLETGAIRLVFLEVIFAPLYEQLPGFDELFRFLRDRGFRFVGLYTPFFTGEGYMAFCDALFAYEGES